MCGIVGIAAHNLTALGVGVFNELMIVSNLRGRWGAGICAAEENDIRSFKTTYSGVDAIDMKSYQDFVREKNVSTLLGHTRWPTKGGSELADSHPHSFKNITGVHNGTLDKVDGNRVRDEDSDSFSFYKHANEVGFKRAHARIQGAFAFVYIDHHDRTLNFIRNAQRPLWFAKIDWGKKSQTLVWASEKEMLQFVLQRHPLIKDIVYQELPINELWSLPIGFGPDDDFAIEKQMYAGSDLWKAHNFQRREVAPEWGAGFRGNSTSNNTKAAASPLKGKGPWVYKDGEFLEKSSLLNPPAQKVSLPRPQANDELEGTAQVRLNPPASGDKGVSDEQRSKVASKVSLGSNGAAFLRSLTGKEVERFLSPSERAFNSSVGDTVVDLYPSHARQQQIDEDFEKLLAQKDAEQSAQLWEDCQFEEDTAPAEHMTETLKGHYIPRREYLQILQNGCAWYGEAADESSEVYWLDRESFILAKAISDPEAMNDLSLHYPNHPLMEEWQRLAKKKRRGKTKDVTPHHVTVH